MKWGDVQFLLRRASDRAEVNGNANGTSVVNPNLTHRDALDILTKAIAERDPKSEVDGRRDYLMLRNIQRECGGFS